jgi:hypothetical protein
LDLPALLTPLLYFVSFAAVLVLFATAVGIAVWACKRAVITLASISRAVTEPPSRFADRRDYSPHPNHLKRAGQ